MEDLNPYFVAYCRVHGIDPRADLAKDINSIHDGSYAMWIKSRKADFVREFPDATLDGMQIIDHACWFAFLMDTPAQGN